MLEQTPSENGGGENAETVIEMDPVQQESNQESDLGNEGDLLARDLHEVGSTVCLARSIMIVSLIILVYVILLIILVFTVIIDVC